MAVTNKQQVQQMLAAAAAACDEKKAEDIRILALDPAESGLTDYFLICTGMSDRQNIAITDEIELRMKRDFGTYPNSVEGRRQGDWILMDYVDFIVHVFSADKRAFYGLERLRKSATSLSVDELHAEMRSTIAAGRSRKSASVKSATPRPAEATKTTASKKAVAKKTKLAGKKPMAKKSSPPTKRLTNQKPPAKPTKVVPAKKSATRKTAAKPAPARKTTARKPKK